MEPAVGGDPAAGSVAQRGLSVAWVGQVEASAEDPQRYRILVRNIADTEVSIRHLTLVDAQGQVRPVTAEDPQILWWRATPSRLAPGAYAEVRIQGKRREQAGALARVGLLGEGCAVAVDLPQTPAQMRIHRVVLDRQANCAVVAVEDFRGTGLESVTVAGHERQVSARAPVPGLAQVVAIPLPEDVRAQTRWRVVARSRDGREVQALVPVGGELTVAVEHGGRRLDAAAGAIAWAPLDAVDRWVPELAESEAIYLRGCLTHEHDGAPDATTVQRKAWEVLRRLAVVREHAPARPAAVHVCKYRQDAGLAWFAGIADAVRINAYHVIPERPETRGVRSWSELLAQAARRSGSDHLHVVVPLTGPGDEDLWARVLVALAHGVDGLHFRRVDERALAPAEEAHVRQVMSALAPTLPLWAATIPVGRIPTADADLHAWLVLVGRRRAALVVVDDRIEPEARAVQLAVSLPNGWRAQRLLGSDGREIDAWDEAVASWQMEIADFRDAGLWFVELSDAGW